MFHKAWNSKGEVPFCFPRSSVKFQGHTVQNITDFDPNWAFLDYRPVAAFKSLRFALFMTIRSFDGNDLCSQRWKCIGASYLLVVILSDDGLARSWYQARKSKLNYLIANWNIFIKKNTGNYIQKYLFNSLMPGHISNDLDHHQCLC